MQQVPLPLHRRALQSINVSATGNEGVRSPASARPRPKQSAWSGVSNMEHNMEETIPPNFVSRRLNIYTLATFLMFYLVGSTIWSDQFKMSMRSTAITGSVQEKKSFMEDTLSEKYEEEDLAASLRGGPGYRTTTATSYAMESPSKTDSVDQPPTSLRSGQSNGNRNHAVLPPLEMNETSWTPTLLQPGQSNNSLLLASYIFGSAYMEKKYVRIFAETSVTSGADIVLVGDTPPPFPLPPNVRHIHLSWPEFIDRAEILLDLDLSVVKKASPYKVIDFKPLFAALFPNLVKPYTFWGYCDNDMILGDFSRLLTPKVLASADIMSIMAGDSKKPKITHGPLTILRNTPTVNTLYTQGTDIRYIFQTDQPRFFDEWGQHQKKDKKWSMSHIIYAHRDRLGLSQSGFPSGIVWDGACFEVDGKTERPDADPDTCARCAYVNGTVVSGDNWDFHPIFCHFEKAKDAYELSLTNDAFVEEILQTRSFKVDQFGVEHFE